MRTVVRLATAVLFAWSAAAHEGWGVVVHERLGVLVSDIPGNTIWRVEDGRATPLLRRIHSHALVATADGMIYGTNAEPAGRLASVWRVDARGRFSYVLPPAADVPLGLQSFFITDDGTIYSVIRYDHRHPRIILLRRDANGQVASVAGGFSAIDGIRQDRDGSLIVADGVYLRRIRRDGSVAAITPPLTRVRWGEDLLGLSSIDAGTIHVADHAGRRVLRVRLATGESNEVDASVFFWSPSGVEWSRDTLYILEHLRPPLSILGDLQVGPYLRVRAVDRNGKSRVLAVVWGRHSAEVAAVLLLVGLVAAWFVRRRALR